MTKARDLANASTALSAVSATELGYLDGVTSAVQTQIDSKAASATAVSTDGGSTITVASGTTVPLTIQNNGTGNSLVVNDEASDTTNLVVNASGNVGIGTGSPTTKLHVNGEVLSYGSTNYVKVERTSSDSAVFQSKTSLGHFGTGTGIGVAANCWNIFDYTASAERMRIDNSGNVGIGKTPSYKLDVDGTVNATALYVGGSPLSSGGMTLIASVSPTGVGTYTFSSIPSTYKNLILLIEGLSSSAGEINMNMRFNSDTGNNYTRSWIRTVSSTVSGQANDPANNIQLGNISCRNTTALTRLQAEITIHDYASSQPVKFTNGTSYGNGYQTSADQPASAVFNGGWSNTGAITSITVYDANGPYNFSNGTIKLYGVS